jgi:hypothetical protein
MTLTTLTDGTQRKDYTTKETAEFIRQALKAAFPGVKFSVRTSYASMTSSTGVRWTDGPTTQEVDRVTDRFTSRGFDGMTDSSTYHDQIFNGERVHFSGWVHTTRDISADLLRKALNRYNLQRAEYGFAPAALEVKDEVTRWGRSIRLEGADMSTANPCGGAATWCPDAVHHLAYHMRPNGVLVTMKRDINHRGDNA